MEISIVVCTHKVTDIPECNILKPIFVGKNGKDIELPESYLRDDAGDNISILNHSYCELTGLYYAWKSISSPYIGLCHYRRYFSFRYNNVFKLYLSKMIHYFGHIYYALLSHAKVGYYFPFQYIISDKDEMLYKTLEFEKDLLKWLSKHPDCCLLALKPVDNGSLSNYYKFASVSGTHHLEIIRNVLASSYPEILKFYNKTLLSNKLYYANMVVMKKDLFDSYCEFLFSTLKAYNKILVEDCYYQSMSEKSVSRISGYMGELLTSTFVSYYIHNNDKEAYKLLYQIQYEPNNNFVRNV